MKIQVIMCPTDRAPYVTNIEDSLQNMQKIVGGNIEAMHIMKGCVVILNEEGRLLGLPENNSFCMDGMVGDCFICGDESSELVSIRETDKQFLFKCCKNRWQERWEARHGI